MENARASRPTFTYLGHSTVSCRLPDGQVLLIDPWLEGNPSCPAAHRRPERVDAMLISHGHFDHMGDAVTLAKRLRPQVVANFEICTWLDGKGVENTSAMNLGGSQEVLGLSVAMVRADHSSGIVDHGAIVYGGLACGYVVRTPGGFTFYHAGDTALFSDMQLIGEMHRPELAFLPCGDLFTMEPRHAAIACRLLGVRKVIPIHWGTFPALRGTPEQLAAALHQEGVTCEVIHLAPGESY
jgi:L-ascorbate metabolism protein UlaG (beta-lactamase superfamily)